MKFLYLSACMPLIVSLFVSFPVFAAVDTYPVAKLTSGIAIAPASMFGSGLVFRFNNGLYVLTSDHVLIRESSKSVRHSVKFEGGDYDADYIMSDWARRFAILKLKDVPANVVSNSRIQDFQNLITDYNGSSKYTLMGYPASSQTLHAPSVGSWISLTLSTIASFGYDSYLMSKDTLAEFGMSGGPVFEEQAGGTKLLGLLSHQIYKPSKNSIDEFGPGTILNGNYTIVVPGREIQNVIEKVLTDGRSPDWNFEEFANSNAKTKEIVGSGNLVFTTQIDPVDQEIETFEVSYSNTPKSQTVRYKDSEGLFDSFEQALLANPSKNLNILAFRAKSFGGFPKFESYSLTMQSMAETFLTITVWGDPVIVIGTPDENQISNDVDGFSKKLESLNCKMKSGASSSAKFDVEALCVYIRRVQLALKNTGSKFPKWRAVKPTDIDSLLLDHSVAWLNVSDSVELKAVLNEVRNYLKPITL